MFKHFKVFVTSTLGAAIAAFGMSIFLIPNRLVTGGVSGIATVLHYLTNIQVGTYVLLINIPIFALGIWQIGRSFGLRTLYATAAFSLFLQVFSQIPPITGDLFIASVFGGVINGVGLGVVFLGGATTGGTDIVATLLRRIFKAFPIGKLVMATDTLVIAFALIVFRDLQVGLYSIIALFVSTHMIDLLVEGADFAKLVYIVTDQHEQVASQLGTRIKRGTTGLFGQGMYSKDKKTVLLCTVKRGELPLLKEIVKNIDKEAFVILTDAREVLGLGFKT